MLGAGLVGPILLTARGASDKGLTTTVPPVPTVNIRQDLPVLLGTFLAGRPASLDLSAYILNYKPGVTNVRLRAITASQGRLANLGLSEVAFESQFREYRFTYPVLHYDGTGFPSLSSGASAARLRIEATDSSFDGEGVAVASGVVSIRVDAPLARIKHGLEEWRSFDELTRTIRGKASPGSHPAGRTDLIGATFEITPGMFSEDVNGSYDNSRENGAAATIQCPCTIRAFDLRSRPVFRSTSGERNTVLIQAIELPQIAGEIVLQDLVIRDNRGWYNTGEGGVRIKDSLVRRSVVIERCEFLRCQNAIAGGGLGQTIKIHDCRIVDCGFGDQAHGLYISPEWLEFFGNVVTFSAGNRLARAHLLKTRALNARILANQFSMNDCAASYLIDISNGGVCEIGGNILRYGPASDNRSAVFVAFAPEGTRGDFEAFAGNDSRRRFQLSARNNTLISEFPGQSTFFFVHEHQGSRTGREAESTFPDPLVIMDNVYSSRGTGTLVVRRDWARRSRSDSHLSGDHPDNSMVEFPRAEAEATRGAVPRTNIINSAGAYEARRFTGSSYLGTGSVPYAFTQRGAA